MARSAGGVPGQHHTLNAPIKTVKRARKLRKEMPLPEVLLWLQLRQRPGGFKFRRQHPIENLVVDFACLEVRLCIEVDGEAHNRGDQPERDKRRDAFLSSKGYETMRVPAAEVLGNMEGVIIGIVSGCRARAPSVALRAPPPRPGEDLEA